MYKAQLIILLVCLISFTCVYTSIGQERDFNEQLIGWLIFNVDDPFITQAGIRYLPELKSKNTFKNSLVLKTDLSLNAYGNVLMYGFDSTETNAKIKPYRLQLGLSGDQFEARVGLQKISFGSASMLRPLMWFDRLDPRDPLQLTDGVYSVLGKYYFLNNANIWFWTLYSNKDTKGWEIFPSNEEKPEIGGRIQLPFFIGEIAGTYHYREGVFNGTFADTLSNRNGFSENRYAIDGKFDLEIGFWFEAAIIHQNLDFTDLRYQRLINVGADYTFGLGNGLNMITEYFTYQKAESAFGNGSGIDFGAISLNYPLNIINNIQAIVYYDFTNKEYYRFINFSWTYDNWMIYIMGFWNPERFNIYNYADANIFAGKGFQLMVTFNH